VHFLKSYNPVLASDDFISQDRDLTRQSFYFEMEEPKENSEDVVSVGNETPRVLPNFQVNRDIIESVAIENQSEELRFLGITVYDQSKFEESILRQVDDALEEQERHKQAINAKKILASKDVDKEKTVVDKPLKIRKETEKEKMVRLGQMTPFGTVLNSAGKTTELTSFEKYMLEQEKLRNEKTKVSSKKGKTLKSPASAVNHSDGKQLVKKVTPKSQTKTTSKSGFQNKYDSDSDYSPSNEESPKPKKPGGHQRKKIKQTEIEKEWNTDDSNWEYSEDEETPKKRKSKKTSERIVDDGNVNDFRERLAALPNNFETENQDCEEFEGGYRIPLSIWNQLYNYQKVSQKQFIKYLIK
jgi:DNA excision repair protein ERCC-6